MGLHRNRKTAEIEAQDASFDGAATTAETKAAAAIVALHPASGTPFTPIEAKVIELARADTLASLEPPTWIERAIAFAFGLEAGRKPLADQRLETLRRAVVVTHHRRHMPDPIAAELAAIGYWAAQIRAIEALAIA